MPLFNVDPNSGLGRLSSFFGDIRLADPRFSEAEKLRRQEQGLAALAQQYPELAPLAQLGDPGLVGQAYMAKTGLGADRMFEFQAFANDLAQARASGDTQRVADILASKGAVKTVDLGDKIAFLDRFGEIISTEPKNLAPADQPQNASNIEWCKEQAKLASDLGLEPPAQCKPGGLANVAPAPPLPPPADGGYGVPGGGPDMVSPSGVPRDEQARRNAAMANGGLAALNDPALQGPETQDNAYSPRLPVDASGQVIQPPLLEGQSEPAPSPAPGDIPSAADAAAAKEYTTSRAREVGKEDGIKQSELGKRLATFPQLLSVVNDLSALGKKATYTYTGRVGDLIRNEVSGVTGMVEPSEGAVARDEYISRVDNEILPLLRETFGSQFTQKEGESLKVTLGDPNKTPQSKDAVLRSSIKTKMGTINSIERHLGLPETQWPPFEVGGESISVQPTQPAPATQAAQGPTKISSQEDYAALPSGAQFIDPQGNRRTKR